MRRIFILTILAAAVVGCESTAPSDRIPAELAGTWSADASCATCTFTVTSVANPDLSVDLLDPPALQSVELVLSGSGASRLTFQGVEIPGTARAEGGVLILTGGGGTDTIDYTVSGSSLTMDFRGSYRVVDFTGDAVEDPGTMHAILRRE